MMRRRPPKSIRESGNGAPAASPYGYRGGGHALRESLDNGQEVTETCQLVAAAIRQRWPIPPEARAALPEAMCRIALNEDGRQSTRQQIRAMRVILAMDAQNQRDEHRAMRGQQFHPDAPDGLLIELPPKESLPGDVIRELLNDPRYIEFCRQNDADCDPDLVGKALPPVARPSHPAILPLIVAGSLLATIRRMSLVAAALV